MTTGILNTPVYDGCDTQALGLHIFAWNADTISSPYKQASAASRGLVVHYSNAAGYGSQIGFDVIYGNLYHRGLDNGAWKSWAYIPDSSDLLNLTYNYDGTKGKTVYEVGTAFTGGTSNTVRTSKITFKTKFTSPPRILITDITSDPSLQRSSVMDAGIFGFTLCTKRTDTERADVFWVAVGT